MSYQATHPGYAVRVDGIPLGRTRFAIQATVAYEPQLTPPERRSFVSEAQLEILLAVVGEWERARRLGAQFVRIAVLGDRALDRFFRDWVHGSLAPVEAIAQSSSHLSPRRGPRDSNASSHPLRPMPW
jgi:hypothetical protein